MPDERKTLLIVNPRAGHGRGMKHFVHLQDRLNHEFKNLKVRISEYSGHAVEISRRAVDEGFRRIISVGGDGTPFEIINGLYADGKPGVDIELGMIPAGTGNSFIRDFSVVNPEQSLDRIVKGKSRKVDLIEFESMKGGKRIRRYYLNILGIGLIADILKLTNERLKFLGSFGYSLAVMLRLVKGMNNRMILTVDDRRLEIRDSALVISNSKFTGGKMKIAPQADTQDGKVDLVIFREVNRRDIVGIFRNVFQGKHIAHPKVDTYRASAVTLECEPQQLLMADGEMLGETPLTLKVRPGELSVLV
jgi:diacylglycerol kinase (ATP)